IMGAYYAHFYSVLSFRMVSMALFGMLMVMMLVGGLGQFPGAILGAFFIVTASELMNPLGAYRDVIMGALAVILVLALPNGVMGLFLKPSAGEVEND
ncbi:MAG: hypothetical protein JSV31_04620, partial [Desulfobacterales bacterium]